MPDAETRKKLEEDYIAMVEAGSLFGEPESFDELMKRCESLQNRANGVPQPPGCDHLT
ncbi:hypothetical protein [Bradyrhizobium liaoningense]|uniref:hypothetical protein n=1 Tax=Bradyrhizobium liaoningense TaxID=43992 RepID=UPI001BAE135D|nr:hypothetical protein [Bradyrhizobium liaoningense]MBR0713970.1 hypothetical protein [Bradyrhizobium liaoningense]